jgi:FtsP/CotA-like multicopper oxidase with cupredoxin domain
LHYRRNRYFLSRPKMSHPTHDHGHPHAPASIHDAQLPAQTCSVLAMPAWLRVLAVLPVLLALWLAVWWANAGAGALPW